MTKTNRAYVPSKRLKSMHRRAGREQTLKAPPELVADWKRGRR